MVVEGGRIRYYHTNGISSCILVSPHLEMNETKSLDMQTMHDAGGWFVPCEQSCDVFMFLHPRLPELWQALVTQQNSIKG